MKNSEKGEHVVQLWNPFIFFLEGKLRVYTILENGKKVLYRLYNPLSFIGDLKYVIDNTSSVNFEEM